MSLILACSLFIVTVALSVMGISMILNGQLGGGSALCAVAGLLFIWITSDEYGPFSIFFRHRNGKSESE